MWKVPPTCSLSPRRLQSVHVDHSRTDHQLSQELTRLDKQRQCTLRQLEQETRHFVQDRMRSARSHASARSRESSPCGRQMTGSCSPDRDSLCRQASEEANRRSPSPRLPDLAGESGQRSRSCPKLSSRSSPRLVRSPSPRAEQASYGKPTAPSGLEWSSTKASGTHAPEKQKSLLPRRQHPACSQATPQNVSMTTVTAIHDPALETNPFVTHKATAHALTSGKKHKENSIPQIIVSDSSVNATTRKKPAPKDGEERGARPVPSSDRSSLSVQLQRNRSRSEPSLASSAPLLPVVEIAPVHGETSDVDSAPGFGRTRSSSVCVPYFAHLKHSPRRESLLEKYTVRPGLQRRTARTIQQLISELSRGVSHEELSFHDPRVKPISDAEWQELRKCRYLRMPSQEDNVVKENTLDLDAIFSHTSE